MLWYRAINSRTGHDEARKVVTRGSPQDGELSILFPGTLWSMKLSALLRESVWRLWSMLMMRCFRSLETSSSYQKCYRNSSCQTLHVVDQAHFVHTGIKGIWVSPAKTRGGDSWTLDRGEEPGQKRTPRGGRKHHSVLSIPAEGMLDIVFDQTAPTGCTYQLWDR